MSRHQRLVGWALLILAVCTALSCEPSELGRSATSADLVITNATLIDGTGAPPRSEISIFIQDGRISEVVAGSDVQVPPGATVLDVAGKYVIPGLADMHAHFSLGNPLPRRSDETEAVLSRLLYYGITSILQLGGVAASPDSIRALQELRNVGALQSPSIYATGGQLTLPGAHPVYTILPPATRQQADSLAAGTPLSEPVNLYPLGLGVSLVRTEEAAREAVRERAQGGMDAIKIVVESGPTPFGDDHPQMSVDMIRAIVDEAAQFGLPVFAHVSSLDELEASMEGGATGVAHAVRDRPLPDEAIADQMVAQGFSMIPTLWHHGSTLSYLTEPGEFDDPFFRATVSDEEVEALSDPEFIERVRSRRDLGNEPGVDRLVAMQTDMDEVLANVAMLHRRGVHIALGTDSGNPYVVPGYSVHRDLELLVEAGLTEMEAVESATRSAAEMIGKEQEFGTIERGKRADLLILREDPLADIRNTRSLETVIANGQVVDREAIR